MYNFKIKKHYEMTQTLSATAMGRIKADTVIKNAKLVNVCTSEIIENTDICIKEGRIALVGNADHCIGDETHIIDANGQYAAPGFMDGHVHLESSMLTATEYSKTVIKHGTTAVFMDPHEITNVLGLKGLKYIMDDGKNTPLKVLTTTPSCVPALPQFEDSGFELTPEDVEKTMSLEEVVGLGEMMNYPGIINGEENPHKIVDCTLKAKKIVTGHYPEKIGGMDLNAYIAAGARCCHETTNKEVALEKMRLGMYAMIREGSAWHDLTETIKAITENKIDSRFAVLVTDDAHPHTLLEYGHLDYLLKRSVEEGLNPITAVQMVTINVAQCFKMDDEFGSITPGKCADIVLLKDLKDFKVSTTLINGIAVFQNEKLTIDIKDFIYPEDAKNTLKIPSNILDTDFIIKAPKNKQLVDCRVIEVVEAKVYNYEKIIKMKVTNGEIIADIEKDIIKACVIERHKNSKRSALGLIKGFGIKSGAIASTVSHDAHNLLIVGTNDKDMALCGNTLKEVGGGMAVCKDGKVLGLMPLPIAGLMSQLNIEEAAKKIEELDEAYRALGCDMVSPFMTMALMALACLPELRITNRGLVDCRTYEFVSLFV